MGTSPSKGSADDSSKAGGRGVRLRDDKRPALLCSNGFVTDVEHASRFDRQLAELLGGWFSSNLYAGQTPLDLLFGRASGDVLSDLMNRGGAKPFAVRVAVTATADGPAHAAERLMGNREDSELSSPGPPHAEREDVGSHIVVVGHTAVDGCCTMPVWRLVLLSENDALQEKALAKPKLEGVAAPLQFQCSRCKQHSIDGLKYTSQRDIVMQLRDQGAVLMHRVAVSKCRRCRHIDRPPAAAAGTAAAGHQRPTLGMEPVGNHHQQQQPAGAASVPPGDAPPRRDRRSTLNPDEAALVTSASTGLALSNAPSVSSGFGVPETAAVVVLMPDSRFAARLSNAFMSMRIRCVSCTPEDLSGGLDGITHIVADVLGGGTSAGLPLLQSIRRRGFKGGVMAVSANDTFGGAAIAAGADIFMLKNCTDVQLRVTLYDFVFPPSSSDSSAETARSHRSLQQAPNGSGLHESSRSAETSPALGPTAGPAAAALALSNGVGDEFESGDAS